MSFLYIYIYMPDRYVQGAAILVSIIGMLKMGDLESSEIFAFPS